MPRVKAIMKPARRIRFAGLKRVPAGLAGLFVLGGAAFSSNGDVSSAAMSIDSSVL